MITPDNKSYENKSKHKEVHIFSLSVKHKPRDQRFGWGGQLKVWIKESFSVLLPRYWNKKTVHWSARWHYDMREELQLQWWSQCHLSSRLHGFIIGSDQTDGLVGRRRRGRSYFKSANAGKHGRWSLWRFVGFSALSLMSWWAFILAGSYSYSTSIYMLLLSWHHRLRGEVIRHLGVKGQRSQGRYCDTDWISSLHILGIWFVGQGVSMATWHNTTMFIFAAPVIWTSASG